MKRKTRIITLAAALIMTAAALPAGSPAEETPGTPGEAPDITADCRFRVCYSSRHATSMTDRKYTTYWENKKTREPWFTVTSETPIYGVYLCFRQLPERFELQVPERELAEGEKEEDRTWVTLMAGDTRFQHSYYALDGVKTLRIQSSAEKAHTMGISEIFLFGKGEVPGWVQRWEPTEEKADILFFSAHPDDELLFLGGAIPTYAAEKKKRVVVAYLSYGNPARRSEALNGLWTLGVRHYPEFGGFRDKWSNKLAEAYKSLGREKVLAWVTEMYRKHRPEAVVTHDLNGEYGHGQHKAMADAAIQGYSLAADPAEYPESAAKYGPWQVKKLYVHLYGEEGSRTRFDWTVPLESMGGKTGLELAAEAYAMHETQTNASVKIHGKWERLSVEVTGSAFPNTEFGLYATEVGPDETGGDFLEHIEE